MVSNISLNHTHGGNVIAVAGQFGLKPENIIDFSASINPLGISENARRAVFEHFEAVSHYPEQLSETLITEISRFHSIPSRCIIAGNGSTELIYLIPRVFKPKKALLVTPTFSEYKNALSLVECDVDTFLVSEENSFRLEKERLVELLKKRYDLLYICNPGNPTGVLTSKEIILGIVDEASEYGTTCVVDEAFIDFAEDESVKKAATERDNLIVLRSMTKFYGIPGMRVGFAVSSEGNINKMMLHKEPWSVNAIGSIAAVESLRDVSYIEESKIYIAKERDYLFLSLSDITWLKPYPSAANYILVRIERDDMDADILSDRLAKEGLLIRSCTSFDGLGSSFFRVAVRKREENERLVKGLEKVLIFNAFLER